MAFFETVSLIFKTLENSQNIFCLNQFFKSEVTARKYSAVLSYPEALWDGGHEFEMLLLFEGIGEFIFK